MIALAGLALLAACGPHPPPPPIGSPSTGTYRALGNEPFWGLTISPREMVFQEPNGPTRIVEPTPRPIIGIAGEIYQTPRLNVNIVHARCSDGMSDRIYSDKVQVTADGRRFEGCGGEAVAPAVLAGTSWRVAAVNGRSTPAGERFNFRFDSNRLGGTFGCNQMGTEYSRQGDSLATNGRVSSTRMACPDMSFETQAGAILSRPMRMTWAGGDRLTLSNEHGSIELSRSY